ncbi:hypothetical protein DMUE_6164 [Dictyocoela muelleri]|nr:hypothetical protein DMUE_6164 [Dictyocoela muelleri]
MIVYLRSRGLLRQMMYCEKCNLSLRLTKYKRNADGQAFVCQRVSCSNFKKYINIRRYYFFENYVNPISDVILVLYYFFTKKKQIDLSRDFGLHKNFITKIYKGAFNKIDNFLQERPVLLGGNGIICQVDNQCSTINKNIIKVEFLKLIDGSLE